MFIGHFYLVSVYKRDQGTLPRRKNIFVLNDTISSISKSNKERYVCKNNYSLIYVFQLLVSYLFFVDITHTYWILILLIQYHLIRNTFSFTKDCIYDYKKQKMDTVLSTTTTKKKKMTLHIFLVDLSCRLPLFADRSITLLASPQV